MFFAGGEPGCCDQLVMREYPTLRDRQAAYNHAIATTELDGKQAVLAFLLLLVFLVASNPPTAAYR